MSSNVRLLMLTSLVICLCSCAPKIKTNDDLLEDKQAIDTVLKTDIKNKILFLNYFISKTNNGAKKIKLISKLLSEGKIKKNSNRFITKPSIQDLEVTQVDDSKRALKKVFIKNPLSKIIEYTNENNALEKRKIELNEIAFSIRMQLKPKTKFIIISEIANPNSTKKHLITTTIY